MIAMIYVVPPLRTFLTTPIIGASIGAYHVQPIILIILPKLALKVDTLTSCFFIRHPQPPLYHIFTKLLISEAILRQY
jgi:hypothetical protein